MKPIYSFFLLVLLTFSGLVSTNAWAEPSICPALLDSTQRELHSTESIDLCQFAGLPLLIVNTASHCGFTGQFKGLEALHKEYAARGLVVLGFPSNDFNQEEKEESKTAEICFINYGVTFLMLSTSSVAKGKLNPVFKELDKMGAPLPRWNFHKYLINGDGELVGTFGSKTEPESAEMKQIIEKLLQQP
ncbi:glutathione peroxidase [Marinospirillum insulare]|uniref:Glutathione peroxidase n=1 Tax=Marinospirillum insulare TaxID=217169 RepID=A0ABQ5ZY86_9GAMM|nr:glutathione peroxidase [Marinospirillum insulare]GLR65170.1 glutathione peroxidase [Marinospirillum insulare]